MHPALKELHWLPVVYRIKFELALVMFTIHTHQCPDYLTDSVHPYSNNDPAPLSDQHQLLCSMHEDEIWQQSFLYGRASHVEQFVTRTVYTLLNADSNRNFLACVLMIDTVMPFRSGFARGGHYTPFYFLTYLLTGAGQEVMEQQEQEQKQEQERYEQSRAP